MIMSLKIFVLGFIVVSVLTPTNGQSQGKWTEADPTGFCKQDKRREVAAYCQDLAALQTAVNEERTSPNPDLTTSDPKFTDALNKLNLTDRRSVDNFITSTAANFATNTDAASALRSAGQARPDQKLGANAKASGTASLVSTAGSAELLSLALDTGTVTQSINGTTATLNTNADQLFRLVTASDPDCTVTCTNRRWFESKVLNTTNISATLALAQQSSTTTATTGQASGTTPVQVNNAAIPTGAGRLSSIEARYEVMNKFDPRSDKFKTTWRTQVTALKAKVTAIGDDTDAVEKILVSHKMFSSADPDAVKQVEQAQTKLVQAAAADPSGLQLVDAFESFWNNAVTTDVTTDASLAAAVSKAVQDRAIYRAAWFAALDNAVGNLLTFDYSYNRPLNQPEIHEVKLIYAYNFGDRGMLTFNGAISIYGGTIPAGAEYGRLHDGQISGEYDRTLSGKDGAIQTQLSLAGYWQYQPNPSVLNIAAGTVVPGTTIPLPNGTQEFVGTAGSLWVTQAQFTIKGAGGIRIPIGVSWSNKTDLLQGSKVGAQVGISYNFSSLAGLFGGNSAQ
jgi:hypothetical protein